MPICYTAQQHTMMEKRKFFTFFFLLAFLWAPLSSAGFETARRKMVQTQLIERSLLEPRLLAAFLKVERHLFVDQKYWPQAYADAELPIGHQEKINSPYTVAMLSHIITARHDQRVLEVGTGSGYQAAILSQLVKEVYTIEILPDLGRQAAQRLQRLGYGNVHSKIGNGYLGWPENAPFDGIIVTCSPDHIPQALIDQLAIGGRMVIPISLSVKVEELILIEKRPDGSLKKTNIVPPQFVPLFRGINEF